MIKLGAKVQDEFTGFKGVVTARTEYLYGCIRVLVQPEGLKDGVPVEAQWFDEQRLSKQSKAKAGGPGATPPSRDPP